MKYSLLFLFIISTFHLLFGQSKTKNHKFSFMSGYGFAGSFFVRSYEESPPIPGGTSFFYKKDFIGTDLSFGISYTTGRRSELNFNYTRQGFSRAIKYNNVNIFISSKIRHFNNFFELLYKRKLVEELKSIFSGGIGLYYLSPQQEEVEVYVGGIVWEERNKKAYNLEEAGAMLELTYEYNFQPRVNIGIKSQFYYTISTIEPESITLLPFIRMKL